MRIKITDKRMTQEVAKFLGLPFTSNNWSGVYRFVEGGARIERVCDKPTTPSSGRKLYGKVMEQRIRNLLEELHVVQLVEIEGEANGEG